MTSPLVNAFELLVKAEQLAPRLEAAAQSLAQLPDLTDEKAWLAAAEDRLAAVGPTEHGELLLRALRIPELEGAKRDRARQLQGSVVDALERLYSGISYAGGGSAPLLDVLYTNVKLPQLRKCTREALAEFCAEFDKRLASTYARRMFGTDTYSVVAPALEELRSAVASWRSVFTAPPLADPELQALRDELEARARTVDVPYRQARLLAQAALLPTAELLDAAGLTPDGKRRASERDTHPLLETDPPDPALPSEAEQSEIAALHAQAAADDRATPP